MPARPREKITLTPPPSCHPLYHQKTGVPIVFNEDDSIAPLRWLDNFSLPIV
jgi:hypothetical protein